MPNQCPRTNTKHKLYGSENEDRISFLRKRIDLVTNGNASEYSRLLGYSSRTIHKMLSGESRVSDRALGVEHD